MNPAQMLIISKINKVKEERDRQIAKYDVLIANLSEQVLIHENPEAEEPIFKPNEIYGKEVPHCPKCNKELTKLLLGNIEWDTINYCTKCKQMLKWQYVNI